MKVGLPLKLGIAVVLLFAVVIAACLLWTPVKTRYYAGKMKSNDISVRIHAAEELLSIGKKGKAALINTFDSRKEAKFLLEYWDNVNGKKGMNVSPDTCLLFTDNAYDKLSFAAIAPIHIAVKNGYYKATEFLIAKGADVNRWSGAISPFKKLA